jgi:hypothetical protein
MVYAISWRRSSRVHSLPQEYKLVFKHHLNYALGTRNDSCSSSCKMRIIVPVLTQIIKQPTNEINNYNGTSEIRTHIHPTSQ